jgi:hypothetical protein
MAGENEAVGHFPESGRCALPFVCVNYFLLAFLKASPSCLDANET